MKKITKEEKRRYQIVSRILGVLMRIANVGCWIGVCCTIAAAVIVSVIAPNINVDQNTKTVGLFGKTVSYDLNGTERGNENVKLKDKTITVMDGNTEVVSVKLSDKEVNDIEKFVENDLKRTVTTLPIILAMVVVLLGAYAIVFHNAAKLFKNIATKNSVFSEENVNFVQGAFKYSVIGAILGFTISFVSELMIGFRTNIVFETTSISTLLALYVLIYIFRAGYQLSEEKAKEE